MGRRASSPKEILPLFFVLPALFMVASVIFFPLVYSLYLSLTNYTLFQTESLRFVSLQNYWKVLNDPVFYQAFVNTLIILLVGVNVEFLLGFGIATLLDGLSFSKLRSFYRASYMLPIMLPPVVVGLQYRFFFDDVYGLINQVLISMGIIKMPIIWLVTPPLPIISILLTEIWENTPVMILILFAGLQALPREPFEAADIDGASYWQKLRYITVPMMKTIILIAYLIRSLDAFRIFDIVQIMTGGGPAHASEVMGTLVCRTAITGFDFAYGSAMSYVSIIVSVITALYLFRQIKKERETI
jgi:multiple sugar transport system permease protein